MSEFINALMKTEPEIFKTETEKQEPDGTNMSLQDMKDYFDAMKESMMSEFKKEIDAIKVQSSNGNTENESNTNSGDTGKRVHNALVTGIKKVYDLYQFVINYYSTPKTVETK